MNIVKRDGREERLDMNKPKTILSRLGIEEEQIGSILTKTFNGLQESIDKVSTELISNRIVEALREKGLTDEADKFEQEHFEREKSGEVGRKIVKAIREAYGVDAKYSNMRRENANIDSNTAMGTMLKYGSEAAKYFYKEYIVDPKIKQLHDDGWIHIHDLDFFGFTETCCNIPLDRVFKGGFNTGHGFLREPSNIITSGALAAIALQSNQNDQHGGQSFSMFDFYMAPYVALTFVKHVASVTKITFRLNKEQHEILKNKLIAFRNSREDKRAMSEACIGNIRVIVEDTLEEFEKTCTPEDIDYIIDEAKERTDKDTFQSMEAFIGNLNTMHSRAGSQVPFSSINYGTDTSVEGRMVSKALLLNTEAGLGNGEVAIFPNQIWKQKAGVNFNPGDPNYDLYRLAIRVTAKRMFPNIGNLDAPYNAELYVEGKPETEVGYMGCRTRVGHNVYDPNSEVTPGRGNLSFTSINLPRLAICAEGDIDKFFESLGEMMENVKEELDQRFEVQCQRHPRNFPFLMGQGVWLGSEKLGPDDDMRSVLKHGSLTVGFIGLAETLIALTGKHHGESEEAQQLGLKIIGFMRDRVDAWAEAEKMNYTLIATPAEGLSGRFVRMDKARYGEIPGVTDKKYYTNSFHVPVYYNISAYEKIDKEAPYHALCNGGHISYIELDGDPSKNLKAIEKIFKYMHDAGIGYGAVNHPVDRDPVCGYVGIIDDVCPRCGRREGEPMTEEAWARIKGYAGVGNADTLGAHGDINEEKDRVTNSV